MVRAEFNFSTDLQSYEQQVPEWIHIMPLGNWDNTPSGNPWKITLDTVREIKTNFDRRVTDTDAVPLDLHHNQTLAPGWIRELQVREDGLWARVEWTAEGTNMLQDKQYRFVSPEWFWSWKRPRDGASFRNVLTGLALTNKPFFRELPPLVAQASTHTTVGPLPDSSSPFALPGAASPAAPMTEAQASREIDRLAQARAAQDARPNVSDSDKYAQAVSAVLRDRADLRKAYYPWLVSAPEPEPVEPADLTPAQASREIDRLAKARAAQDTRQSGTEVDRYMDAVKAVQRERPDLYRALYPVRS